MMERTGHIILKIAVGSDLTALAVQMALRAALPSAEVLIDQRQQPGACAALILDDYTVHGVIGDTDSRTKGCLLLYNHREPHHIQRMMDSGIQGYLFLGDSLVERLPQAVKDVVAGGRYLSPTAAAALAQIDYYARHIQPRINPYQYEVLRLMSQHWSGGRIAAQLGRSTTAIYQVQRFLRDLFEVESNGELLDSAVQLGILPDTRRISA
jgi:DNA-binding NarL/FixJ family response regulator